MSEETPSLPPTGRERQQLRRDKRILKRAGNKRLRHRLKHELAEDPETAHFSDTRLDAYKTEHLNGQDGKGQEPSTS